MPGKAQVKLVGEGAQFDKLLGRLELALRTKASIKAVKAGGQVVAKKYRSLVARQADPRSGSAANAKPLHRVIKVKTEDYPGGRFVAVVGARVGGTKANRTVTGIYAPMVEEGTGGDYIQGSGDKVRNPGDHALKRAYISTRDAAEKAMVAKLREIVESA